MQFLSRLIKVIAIWVISSYLSWIATALAQSRPAGFDPISSGLLYSLSTKPELMNPAYLRYTLGSPKLMSGGLGYDSSTYIWASQEGRTLAELHQEAAVPGRITKSTMTFYLDQGQLTVDQLQKMYGNGRQIFDFRGHPCLVYCLAPHTSTSFSIPQNSFNLSTATLSYNGPGLPSLGAGAIQSARDAFLAKAPTLDKLGDRQVAARGEPAYELAANALLKLKVLPDNWRKNQSVGLAAGSNSIYH